MLDALGCADTSLMSWGIKTPLDPLLQEVFDGFIATCYGNTMEYSNTHKFFLTLFNVENYHHPWMPAQGFVTLKLCTFDKFHLVETLNLSAVYMTLPSFQQAKFLFSQFLFCIGQVPPLLRLDARLLEWEFVAQDTERKIKKLCISECRVQKWGTPKLMTSFGATAFLKWSFVNDQTQIQLMDRLMVRIGSAIVMSAANGWSGTELHPVTVGSCDIAVSTRAQPISWKLGSAMQGLGVLLAVGLFIPQVATVLFWNQFRGGLMQPPLAIC